MSERINLFLNKPCYVDVSNATHSERNNGRYELEEISKLVPKTGKSFYNIR